VLGIDYHFEMIASFFPVNVLPISWPWPSLLFVKVPLIFLPLTFANPNLGFMRSGKQVLYQENTVHMGFMIVVGVAGDPQQDASKGKSSFEA